LTLEQSSSDKAFVGRAAEAVIHISLIGLLAAACLVILLPFIPIIAWGIIIAVAAYPVFQKLQTVIGGREGMAAVIFVLMLVAVVLVPAVLLAHSFIEGIQIVTSSLKSGTGLFPSPPASIQRWPIIGGPLADLWSLASRDLPGLASRFTPQIKAALPGLLSASAGIGLTLGQVLLSIVFSGVLLANAEAACKVTCSLFNRLFNERGAEFRDLAAATIRSVTLGILGVALIQSAFAALGFVVAGMPGAGLWTAVFVFAAVLQVGGLVLIPAAIYVVATASVIKAVIFLVWCAFVGLMDNFLKAILLGRGAAVPVVVVFLGAIGGFVALGIIGLFVGATVLAVGYKLFDAWIEPAHCAQALTSAGSSGTARSGLG
jgi:predicted PurR-regulated permease PerM